MCKLLIASALWMTFGSVILAADPPIPLNYQVSSPDGNIQNEEQISVNPLDSLVLMAVWRDFRLGYRRVGLGISRDGGDTWTDSLINLSYHYRQSDPVMDVDAQGNFYACYMDYEGVGGTGGITVIRSADNGITWSSPTLIQSVTSGEFFEDKQFMTIDRTGGLVGDGNIYLAWARYDDYGYGSPIIVFSRSTDQAATFSEPITVGPRIGTLGSAGQFAQPLVGADGSVYVFWVGNLSPGDGLVMSKSVDYGQSFGTPVLIRKTYGHWEYIEGSIDVYNGPSGAVDLSGGPFHGTIYLSYANQDIGNPPHYDYNIEVIRSTDGGSTWSEPVFVNDDGIGNGIAFDQFHPWLYCNQEGTLVIVFYDQRTDPVNHTKFDLFAAYSFDGGQTFTQNHRISDVSIDPGYLAAPSDDKDSPIRKAASPEAGLLAEYIGVTAFRDHVNAVWTDTRMGSSDVFGANWEIPLLDLDMDQRLIEPVDDALNVGPMPHFDWLPVWKHSDDMYRIEISTDPFFGSFTYKATVDTTGFVPTSGLADRRYFWRVKGFRIAAGDSSDYSETRTFWVSEPLLAPKLIEPVNDALNVEPIPYFDWLPIWKLMICIASKYRRILPLARSSITKLSTPPVLYPQLDWPTPAISGE